MPIEARIKELANRHRDLENQITQALKSPSTETLYLARLKKQKLKLKEEIEALTLRNKNTQ